MRRGEHYQNLELEVVMEGPTKITPVRKVCSLPLFSPDGSV
jgi:hypothetical protein